MLTSRKDDRSFASLRAAACHRLAFLAAVLLPGITGAAEPVEFVRDVVPILQQHCVRCHLPGNEQGDISLATAADVEDAGIISAGDPDSSYLLDVITSGAGEPPLMPKEGEPLSTEQVNTLRQWIADGAAWPEEFIVRQPSRADSSWWSLQPLSTGEPPLPEKIPDSWQAHPIDRFVFDRLVERGLQPGPPADRRSLIRRAAYDLTGLPPSPDEVEAFVANTDPDAWEQLIDRLLASPRYGERWGRHWLDVVRFGESNGFERNVVIDDLWPFRDYVIQSLNDDKPFNEFIREHLAGDVFGANRPDVEIGTAFLVAGPYDDVPNQDPAQAAQIRADTIDEMIRTTSEAFLGLTIGCARCHDHKFDPILQRDYYALYATFAGVRHGSRVVATAEQQTAHAVQVGPLERRRQKLTRERDALRQTVLNRALRQLDTYQLRWSREPVNRQMTEETFAPVEVRFVRLVSEGQDIDPKHVTFRLEEFEVWSAGSDSRNVALASAGAQASGPTYEAKDFQGAYGPQLAIDGRMGERFLAVGGQVTVKLARPTKIDRVAFYSARNEKNPEQSGFQFLSEYRIEVSDDGTAWRRVADSHDRRPVNEAHRNHRLRKLEMTAAEQMERTRINRDLGTVQQQLAKVPALPTAWVGQRVAEDAKGPFHVFVGGSPQRQGRPVLPAALSVVADAGPRYSLTADAAEDQRRLELADWIVDSDNPLTARVLANRVWHYHFGTGIVDTPSDFGWMGGRPTHPKLLDWLANALQKNQWRLKPLHRRIMLSQTYQQSSDHRADAARVDGDARYLWRFPPRRLSAEEIRDTILSAAGKLDLKMGGPGFRLYEVQSDNVTTYVPLDQHGPATWRRAIYHQNVRASVVDLMSDFDQPDCALSVSRRSETTTPLQALTLLNHDFTVTMADGLARRLRRESDDTALQIETAFRLCDARQPTRQESADCTKLIDEHGLEAFCRVLFNTSEMITVK